MLNDLFRTIKVFVVGFGVLLSFFAILEIIRAYQTLNALHPMAGYLFMLLFAVAGLWFGLWFWGEVLKSPRVLTPPAVDNLDEADIKQLCQWAKYQLRFMQRLMDNPQLDAAVKENIRAEAEKLNCTLGQSPGRETILAAITRTENDAIMPAIEELDSRANKQVRDCVRDVMLGVTLSPYKSADILIVLYRNLLMTARIIQTYNSRPTVGQSLRIGVDILNIVATVNYINMGKNLIEALASRLPGVGRLTDDIAQGIGAGFMTSVAGHAAMDRCRAFRRWDSQQAKAGLLNKVGSFYGDVRDIFFTDVWGFVRVRSGQATDQVCEAIRQAFDQTAKTLADCVRIPAKAAVTTGHTVIETTTGGTKAIKNFFLGPFRRK